MTALVRRRRLLRVIPRVNVVVSSAFTPWAAQSGFLIYGNGFGVTTGIVQYGGVAITPTAWANTQVTVNWPDLAFLGAGAQRALDTAYTLAVTTADGAQGTASLSTSKKPGDIFRAITALTGIFANDDVAVGDLYCWRTLNGTIVDVSADGYISGATAGASGQYAVYNGVWTNTATVTLS